MNPVLGFLLVFLVSGGGIAIALMVAGKVLDFQDWWRSRPLSPRRATKLINEQTAETIREMRAIAERGCSR